MKEKLALIFLFILIICGLYASWQVFFVGLGTTNLDNQFVFGLWIITDLTFIALGSGAFCIAFLYYILRRRELAPILPLSVVLGLLCYISAGYILLLEIGQPLRFWFPFRHPNFISMLTEITFCITLYSFVLLAEFLPTLLGHKKLATIQPATKFRRNLILLMPTIALAGIILSLLHQGSLGGVYGVMFARPFAWRPGLYIWPWTFILFITSAMAAGPIFTLLVANIIEKLTSRSLISLTVKNSISRFCAIFLGLNLILRFADIMLWRYWLLPQTGFSYASMFHNPDFGQWLMWMELLPGCAVPLFILASKRLREKQSLFTLAAILACTGLVTNRYIVNLQTMAVPTLPFEKFGAYAPNWIEWAPFLMALACIILALRFLYKNNFLFEKN